MIAQVSKKVDTTVLKPIISVLAIQVELPTRLDPASNQTLRYALVPCTVAAGVASGEGTPALFQTKL